MRKYTQIIRYLKVWERGGIRFCVFVLFCFVFDCLSDFYFLQRCFPRNFTITLIIYEKNKTYKIRHNVKASLCIVHVMSKIIYTM